MKMLLIFCLFSIESIASSGKYKPEPYNPEPYRPPGNDFKVSPSDFQPSDKNYKLFVEDPKPKSERDLKDFIYAISRPGVTINNFNYQQASFTIKGTYKTEEGLNQFLNKVKKSIRSEKGFDLKTTKTRFAGAITNHYEVSITNLF